MFLTLSKCSDNYASVIEAVGTATFVVFVSSHVI